MGELKAEQMLSILTAAETEMYETSKKNEESQILQKSLQNSGKVNVSQTDSREAQVQTDKSHTTEDSALRGHVEKLLKEKRNLQEELDKTQELEQKS